MLRSAPDPSPGVDKLCSFVGKKANPRWVWLALDVQSRQVLALCRRSQPKKCAAVMGQAPGALSQTGDVLHGRLCTLRPRHSPTQRRAITKEAPQTHHVERFNGTLRQRLSRLVRSALSFWKKLAHHIGAIRYFLCHYNLTRTAGCRNQPISP
jgi:insertion element IS1 protein InsB